jgi:hypothetical protein
VREELGEVSQPQGRRRGPLELEGVFNRSASDP